MKTTKNKKLIAFLAIAMFPIVAMSQLYIAPTFAYNFGAKVSGWTGGLKMKGAKSWELKPEL